MVVNDDVGFLDERGALRFFASAARSKLAPVDPLLLFPTQPASLPVEPLRNTCVRPLVNGRVARSKASAYPLFCSSKLAREEPEGAAVIQEASVIVNDHREQARSYSGQ